LNRFVDWYVSARRRRMPREVRNRSISPSPVAPASSASCSNSPSPGDAPEAARRWPFHTSLPATDESMPCSVRDWPEMLRSPSETMLRDPFRYTPSVVVVAVIAADTVTTFVVRLIAVIRTPTAVPAPVVFVSTSMTWPTNRYWVVSTVNVVDAAGEVASVARTPVPSPNTCSFIRLRIALPSRFVRSSRMLMNAPSLPFACLMSWSVSSSASAW
jgi:hypothetical protein